METVVALAETLVPADESPGAAPEWVREFVTGKTEGEPGYYLEYRNAVALLDELAGEGQRASRRFASLSPVEREECLRNYIGPHGWWRRAASRLLWDSESLRRRAHFRQFVVKELVVEFYLTADGWAVVGYSNYPGVPGDSREYTTRPRSVSQT